MTKKQYFKKSILSAGGTLIYIGIVSLVLFNGEKIFGQQEDTFLMPIMMLLLLVLSATITGLLMLGQPISLYFNNQKKEAVKLLFASLSWLLLFLLITIMIIAFQQ